MRVVVDGEAVGHDDGEPEPGRLNLELGARLRARGDVMGATDWVDAWMETMNRRWGSPRGFGCGGVGVVWPESGKMEGVCGCVVTLKRRMVSPGSVLSASEGGGNKGGARAGSTLQGGELAGAIAARERLRPTCTSSMRWCRE